MLALADIAQELYYAAQQAPARHPPIKRTLSRARALVGYGDWRELQVSAIIGDLYRPASRLHNLSCL